MILRATTTYLAPLILTAVQVVGLDSPVLAQLERRSERQLPETARQAEAQFQSALEMSDNQDSKSARLHLLEAMRLWIQMGEGRKAALAALQIGDRHKQAREYQNALIDYRLALNVNSLPRSVKATALNSIAQIYADLYLNGLATNYFKRALAEASIIKDVRAQKLALTGLAEIHRQQGALGKAMECITRALRLGPRGQSDADAALMYLKGQVSQEQGLTENAKAGFAEALAVYGNTGNVAGQVTVLCALSGLDLLASQNEAALKQARLAVELAEKEAKRAVTRADFINARGLRWRSWLRQARGERALGEKASALRSYSRAINHFEAVWWEFYIATEISAVAFREEAQAAYRECVDLLVEEGQFKQAYGMAASAKARTLMNFTGARRARPPSADTKRTSVIADQSRSIARLRLQQLASGLNREQQAKLQKEIQEADYEIEETRLQAEMERSKERLVWSRPATAGQLQEQTTQAQMTLAEFSLGENRSFVWVFRRGEVFFENLPARKDIEKAIRPYLDALAAPPSHLYIERDLAKLRQLSESLFDTLFGRLSGLIEPGERLIIVPDGLLHYLPFEALIHNGHYLVQDHEISYLPSASMVVQLQDSRGHAGPAERMELLAFGDPIFGSEMRISNTKKPKSAAFDVNRNARASRFQLPPLPRTRDEVQYVAGLFPPDRTRLYLGKASTEDAVKRESLRRYRRLHFATHSLIDERSPSRSAVVLTLDADPDEDGFLEVSEISELDLDCDIVVLSACQTGRGQLLSGEGIVGLSRAFFYAGARALVVSFWNVSDISTGQLMEGFYRHLSAGMGNAAALRESKLQMLKSDRETRHPYYWASFVVIGKP